MYRTYSGGKIDYIRFFIAYIERWQLTNIPYVLKNIVSSALVFFLTCYAVRDGAFELREATSSCLFSVLMCSIWSGLFNSIALFYSESDYVMDDLRKVLPVRVYVMANLFLQAGMCFAEALISVVIYHGFFDYSTEAVVLPGISLDYWVTFFLILFSADMLGFAVGVLVKNITTAMTVLPVVLIVQFLFSGCLFDLSGMMKTASLFTTAKWGYSALGSLANYNELSSKTAKLFAKQGIPYTLPTNELFDASADFVLRCWFYMALLTVIATIIAAILLFIKLRNDDET